MSGANPVSVTLPTHKGFTLIRKTKTQNFHFFNHFPTNSSIQKMNLFPVSTLLSQPIENPEDQERLLQELNDEDFISTCLAATENFRKPKRTRKRRSRWARGHYSPKPKRKLSLAARASRSTAPTAGFRRPPLSEEQEEPTETEEEEPMKPSRCHSICSNGCLFRMISEQKAKDLGLPPKTPERPKRPPVCPPAPRRRYISLHEVKFRVSEEEDDFSDFE
jgi:hypothetical protein